MRNDFTRLLKGELRKHDFTSDVVGNTYCSFVSKWTCRTSATRVQGLTTGAISTVHDGTQPTTNDSHKILTRGSEERLKHARRGGIHGANRSGWTPSVVVEWVLALLAGAGKVISVIANSERQTNLWQIQNMRMF